MVTKSEKEPEGSSPDPVAAGQAGTEETGRTLIIAKTDSVEVPPGAPILFVRRRKKRRKRYTRGTKDFQRLQRAFTKAAYRLSDAATTGFERFDRESRRSARRKRDGAAVDVLDNVALGTRDGMREASEVPLAVTEALNTRLLWRGVKYTARVVIPRGRR